MPLSIELNLALSPEQTEAIKSAENIDINTRFGIEKALWLSGKDVQAEFRRQTIAKDKTGRLYVLRPPGGGRKRNHRASAPGQTAASRPPSVGGGVYREGFDFNVRGQHELVVGDTAPHAPWLEVGTSRMAARPGIANSIKASERDIIRNLGGEIELAI